MTSRLNQDALEGMFGMIRSCCGSYDKPDPLLFIQVYRLISFYSLVKPPKGFNVDGLEIFETLLTVKDVSINENAEEWKKVLDEIISRGKVDVPRYDVRHSHDYNVVPVNEHVQAYFSGFVARRVEKWTSCEACISSDENSGRPTEGSDDKPSYLRISEIPVRQAFQSFELIGTCSFANSWARTIEFLYFPARSSKCHERNYEFCWLRV